MSDGLNTFHVFFTELSNRRKRHWRLVKAPTEKSAIWEAKWIAIAKDWLFEEVREYNDR